LFGQKSESPNGRALLFPEVISGHKSVKKLQEINKLSFLKKIEFLAISG
jgi:hypothetical protein